MSTWKKIAIGVGAAMVLLAMVGFGVYQSRKNVITVQTGKVQRLDLASVVSASGEIKPKTYVNIGANAFGKIIRLYVKEGDRVKKGQLLAQLENVQSAADVLPMQVAGEERFPEELRLKYRFIDLRREKIHRNMMLRAGVIGSIRRRMIDAGFTEFQSQRLMV